MQDPTMPLVIEPKQQENIKRVPATGFHTNPERINRKGAPKRDWTFAGELEKALEESTKDGKSVKHHLVRSLLREGLNGNVNAIEKIMDRLDGKPMQFTDVTTLGEKLESKTVLIDSKPADSKT